MGHHDIVVIGASAGGVEALSALAQSLPSKLRAAIFLVLHLTPWNHSSLAEILRRVGKLPAVEAEHGKRFKRGQIHVAVPNQHLLIERDRTLLVYGPKENRVRPAIDPLFRSAAVAYGPRVIGVLLTGASDDGTPGLWEIKKRGGLAVVQDPKEARFPTMPQSARQNVEVDHSVPLAKMGHLIAELVEKPVDRSKRLPPSKSLRIADQIVRMENVLNGTEKLGEPSAYVCPECQGTLYEMRQGKQLHYRCRTGHAFGAASLMAEQLSASEAALWAAMRSLQEKADMLQQRARDLPIVGSERLHLKRLALTALKQAEAIRSLIRLNKGEEEELPGKTKRMESQAVEFKNG